MRQGLNMRRSTQADTELHRGFDRFFDFLLALEEASLLQKKDILNAYFELFECAQGPHLPPLFYMMVAKLFPDKGGFCAGANDKDQNVLINICSKVCKTIMRKLSATHDTEFRGKIQ